MRVLACAVFSSIIALSGPTMAATFDFTFEVNSNAATDPALVIVTDPGLGVTSGLFSFDLSVVGEMHTIDHLFEIGTTENFINIDDLFTKSISTTFNFTAPPPPFGGPVSGDTSGHFRCGFICQLFGGTAANAGGDLEWDGPIQVAFGVGGLLGIEMTDAAFSLASNGVPNFEWVGAKFTLLETTVVPLPAALPLFGTGLGILGFIGWRRKQQTQAV